MTSDYRVNVTISRVTPRSNGGTRTIVGLLAAGRTHEEILQAYPYLEADDIRAARVCRPAYRGSRTALSMKLLLDMNLSPTWVRFLEETGSVSSAARDGGASEGHRAGEA